MRFERVKNVNFLSAFKIFSQKIHYYGHFNVYVLLQNLHDLHSGALYESVS